MFSSKKLMKITKTLQCRATGRPRSSRDVHFVANRAAHLFKISANMNIYANIRKYGVKSRIICINIRIYGEKSRNISTFAPIYANVHKSSKTYA